MPPAPPAIFFGRDEFVRQSAALLTGPTPARLAILGAGGMGKTAAALAILHDPACRRRFGAQRFFVPCEAAATSELLLGGILQALGARHAPGEDALAALQQRLAARARLLLVLDNFETPWDESDAQAEVGAVLQRIAAAAHVALVVTMRGIVSPAGIAWAEPDARCVLASLSREAARRVFLTVNPRAQDTASQHDLELLLLELDGIPLAVVLMAQLGKGQSCSSLLRRWRKEKTALLRTQGSKSGRLTSIEVSISISLKSSSIVEEEPEATQLLALICCLPDGVLKWEETLDEISTGFQHADSAVAALIKVALVYVDVNGTLKMLSPVRHYIMNTYKVDSHHLLTLEQYYIKLVMQYGLCPHGPAFQDAVQQLSPHIGNITSVVKYALQDHAYSQMAHAAYLMSQFLAKVQPSCTLLNELVPKLGALNMEELEPFCYQLMGNILHVESKYDIAREKLMTGLALFTQAGNQLGAAQCLQSLGNILRMEDRCTEALVKLEEAHAQFTQIGDEQGVAQCLRSMGDSLCMQDSFEDARHMLESAHAKSTQIGDGLVAAQCLQSLGDILCMEHKYKEARGKLAEAQAQFTQIGNQLGVAQCLQSLGNIFYMEDQYCEARDKLGNALAQFTHIGNQLGVAQCVQSLGNILYMEEKYNEARKKLEDSLTSFIQMGNQLGAAQSLQGLGNVAYMEEKYAEAKEKLKSAQEQYTLIGSQQGAAHCLQSLQKILDMEANGETKPDMHSAGSLPSGGYYNPIREKLQKTSTFFFAKSS